MVIRGLSIQLNVILALILRETRTRFGEYRIGYLWALLEPIIMIFIFYTAITTLNRPLFTNEVVNFLITGLMPFQLFKQVAISTSNAIDANKSLLYYPQVKVFDLIIARFLLEVWTIAVVLVIIMIANYINQPYIVDDILCLLFAFILASLLGLSIGMLTAAISLYISSARKVLQVLLRGLFFVSCVFYTISDLPQKAKKLVLLNPLTHVIEICRNSWFVAYQSHDYSFQFVIYCIVYITAISLYLLSIAKDRIQL